MISKEFKSKSLKNILQTQQNDIYNMKLSFAVALLLVSFQLAEAGTLTTNNCPANFDIKTANVTGSSSAQTTVDFLYANLYSSADRAALKASFNSGNSTKITKQITTIAMLAPFAVIAAAFAITFIIAICCCVFEKSCPPCKSWKRDFTIRPYEKSQLKCVTVFGLIFAIGIAITSIVGFVFFPKLKTSIQNTKCGLYMSLDVAKNGDQTNGWGGFTQLSNQIGNISSLLSTTSTAVTTELSNNQWLVDDMAALKDQNLNLYRNNNYSTVYSPNSLATSTTTVVPRFISSGLGPNGTSGTMVDDIDSGIRVTEKVSSQGYKVYTAAFLLANSANTINTNLNLAINSLTLNARYITSTEVSLDSFSRSLFDQVFNWGLYLIQGILGFVLAASLLLILGIVATHYFQLYTCKTSVHLGWVAYGVTYFGIVMLTFIFFSFGGISYQFCDFYGSLVTNQAQFSSYAEVTGPSQFNRIFSKLDTCFYDDGNIMKEFSIKQETKTLSDLYAEIETFQNMRDSTTAQYIDLNFSPTKISGWIAAMEKYRLGVYVDADPALTSEDNPLIALDGMNKYTNNGTGGVPPSCTNDYWVFDSTNCTHNATESIYVSNNSTSGTTFASTGTTCISFNQKFQTQNNYSWSVSDISNRYVSRRQCGTGPSRTSSYDNIIKYATSLVNYRDSRINLYQNLKDQLNSLLTSNNNFNSKIVTYTTNVNDFVTATQTLNTLVTNAVNGLDASSDCRTVASHLRFVYNAFCKNFMQTSVQFGICCVVLMAIMIGGTITGAVFATRYGRITQDRKAVRPETPSLQELHSETFEKKDKSSSSSSSSDED